MLNSTTTPKETIVIYGIAGPWHKGPPPPNGCIDGQQERWLWEYEVYSADYYGRGSKLYMWRREWLQTASGMVMTGLSNDGDEKAIARTLERHGVKL